jgi:hypothetical protein
MAFSWVVVAMVEVSPRLGLLFGWPDEEVLQSRDVVFGSAPTCRLDVEGAWKGR